MEEVTLNTETMSKEMLLSDEVLTGIFNAYKGEDREIVLQLVTARANDLNIGAPFKRKLMELQLDTSDEEDEIEFLDRLERLLTRKKDGNVEPTVDNFIHIIKEDVNISQHIKYNVMSQTPEYWENGSGRVWDDNDDARLISYIEKTYGLYNIDKYRYAFNSCMRDFEYHPVKRLIEQEEWDGVPRIDRFLTDIAKCEPSDYIREVSRMIFYGGIHRIYDPGCKFDYMPIFIGPQGCNKSTIVNWLNISSDFYREVLSIDGSLGVESINGGWVCEFSELQGMVSVKDLESLKGYITRQVDNYRAPYARYVTSRPRQCIFIGTTNDYEFLTDKTGNRRYLPVRVGLSKGELYTEARMVYTKHYILECWREALYLMNKGKTYLSIPVEYEEEIKEVQKSALVDDPKYGVIDAYLRSKDVGDKVCGMEIFVECFNGLANNMKIGQSKEIARIMANFSNWEKVNNPMIIGNYGRQKYWKKIGEDKD